MMLVDGFLDLVRAAIFALAQLYGGNLGAAILTLPVICRLILLPLNVRLALSQRRRSEALVQLKPELDRLRLRFEKQPERLALEMQALMRQNGVSLFDARGCAALLLQWPLWGSLYVVVQKLSRAGGTFLWISDISRPDRILALAAAGLTYLGITISASPASSSTFGMAIFVALFTLVIVARTTAGVGLYWVGSAAVSLLQGLLVRRIHVRGA